MNRPWRSRDPTAGSSHSEPAAASAHSASAAIQFAARMATSMVQAQLAPNSTGLEAIQSASWAPISSR